MAAPRKLYLAQPVSFYGCARKILTIRRLKALGWDVVDPDTPEHACAYREQGMAHFQKVVSECDALAYIPFRNGQIGAGVAREVMEAWVRRIPVYGLHGLYEHPARYDLPKPGQLGLLDFPSRNILSIDQTRAAVAEHRAWQNKNLLDAIFDSTNDDDVVGDELLDPVRGAPMTIEDDIAKAVAVFDQVRREAAR